MSKSMQREDCTFDALSVGSWKWKQISDGHLGKIKLKERHKSPLAIIVVTTLFKAQLLCATNLTKLSTYIPVPCFNQALLKRFQITNRHNTVTAALWLKLKESQQIVHEKGN